MCRAFAAALVAAGLVTALPAAAQKSADTLRITWRDAVPDVTPYYNQLRTGIVLGHQVWDSLVYRDPETFQIKPLLAKSYKWVDETTLEFTLRPNVTFHNGDRLTADDVVYTINTILTDKQVSTPSNYAYIDHATKVDDTHVRVELKRVFPAALDYMAMTLYIMPKAYREKVGPQEYSQHPIGAGPYRITKVDGATEIDLERYDGYYADSPKGKPAIGKIVIHEVPDAADRDGGPAGRPCRLDLEIQPRPVRHRRQHAEPAGDAAESMRIEYLGMDAAGRTGADNPLTKEKVRAGDLPCDRSRHDGEAAHAGRFACDRHALLSDAVRLRCRRPRCTTPYDPAKAKQLLAEAGYPNGFDTELVTYELPQWAGAVQGYLKAVGINAKLTSPAGRRRGAALARRAGPAGAGLVGQLLGQRRLGDPAELLHLHRQRLHARSGAEEAGRGRRRDGGSRPAAQGLQRGDQADHREGLLGADVHLHGDLRLLEAAQLQAVSGRAATVLPGKLEVAALCLDRGVAAA